jgi:hypothetical protein
MKAVAASLLIAMSLTTSAVAQSDVPPQTNSTDNKLALAAFDACYSKKFDDASNPRLAQTKQTMREAWGLVYAAHFSQGELRTLTDFCKTPAGQKFIAERNSLDVWLISAMGTLEKQSGQDQNNHGSSK